VNGKSLHIPAKSFSSINRRSFLSGASAVLLTSVAPRAFSQSAETPSPAASLPGTSSLSNLQDLLSLIGQVFSSTDPTLLQFAADVYADCIVGKIRPASAPLMHPFIVPGGGYYAQWLWDTMFVVDLLSLLPGQQETIRGVFQNYWDFQERWNAAKPEFMHGMIANFIAPFGGSEYRDGRLWREYPAYSQAPLLAWGMERVFLRNGDLRMLHDGIAGLENFHEWYWRERDVHSLGLVGVGAYSGDAQQARYETYDNEVDLDDLQLIPHPYRARGSDNGSWYGDIAIPANTAYLLLSEQSLARIAERCGNQAMAARRRARYTKGAHAMRKHMWDRSSACFLAVHTPSLTKIKTPTVGGFMPLMAGVPTPKRARQMAAALASRSWNTPVTIPTVARTAKQYDPSGFWRGDVWPVPNFQVATGLSAYGLRDAAARVSDSSVANAMKAGISEHYDSQTGAPLGVPGLGMSATVLTMMIDGLTSPRYRLRVNAPSRT
jgi:glycogen debranching enzyme